jgi:hypothetical protein
VPPKLELPHALIDPSALRAAIHVMEAQIHPLVRMMEAQVHPLIMAIPRFIQLRVPSPPLSVAITIGCT